MKVLLIISYIINQNIFLNRIFAMQDRENPLIKRSYHINENLEISYIEIFIIYFPIRN